jgi:amphi-Trp domain-containing protein
LYEKRTVEFDFEMGDESSLLCVHLLPRMEDDMSKECIKIKGLFSHAEVVEQLEGLLQGFKTRELCLGDAKTSLTLAPADALDLELKGKSKKDKQKLSIELAWRLPEALPLEVSVTTEPEAAVPDEVKPVTAAPAPASEPDKVQIATTEEFSQSLAFPFVKEAEPLEDVAKDAKALKSKKR